MNERSRMIREAVASGESQTSVARRLGISRQRVCQILKRDEPPRAHSDALERYMAAGVEWYRRFGRYYPERIAMTSGGERYVAGDWSWNLNHPDKPEIIEPLLDAATAHILDG